MKRFSGDKFLKRILKKARRGYRGDPIATISYYGPDDKKATKVSVGIVYSDERGVQQMQRWYNEEQDIRRDPATNEAIFHFIQEQAAASVIRLTEINGCPHEEGIDYPLGEVCPLCPFWAGRERLTDQIRKMVDRRQDNEEDEDEA